MRDQFAFEDETFEFAPEIDGQWEEERSRSSPARGGGLRSQPSRPSRRGRLRPPGVCHRRPCPKPRPGRGSAWPLLIDDRPPDSVESRVECGSENIRWVQSTLNRILHLNLPVNGVPDVQTRSAVRSFQRRRGLPADGIVGPPTERALIEAGSMPALSGNGAPSPDQEFEPFEAFDAGLAGKEFESEVSRNSPLYIRWVQQALNQVMGLRLPVDGIAGPQTRSAIRSFQQRRGLLVDGIAGTRTEAALIASGAKTFSSGGVALSAATTPARPGCEVLDGFDFDRDDIKPFHGPQLEGLAARVIASLSTATPTRQIRIIGHTDRVGSDAYNVALGRRRAEKVRDHLRAAIERRRPGAAGRLAFVIESRGESAPIAGDNARNRRVEVCLAAAAPPPSNCACIPDSLIQSEFGAAFGAWELATPTADESSFHVSHSLLTPAALRSLPPLPQEPPDLFTTTGHKLIEGDALGSLVRQANCVTSIYFGNWQRDFSQMIPPFIFGLLGSRARPLYELIFEVLDVMAEAEFGRRLDRVRFGTYRWEEHIDNPREYCSPTTTCAAIDPRTYEPIAPGRRRPEDAPEAPSLGTHFWKEGAGALPNYLLASRNYVLAQLRLAVQHGPNNLGLEHFGNAMHTVEDFYAHSNFIELGLNQLGIRVDPMTGIDAATRVPVRDSLGRLRLTTGIFLPLDTVVSLQKLLLGAIEGNAPGTPPSNLQRRIVSVLVRRLLGSEAQRIYNLLVEAWERGISQPLRLLLATLGITDLQRAFEEMIVHPLRVAIADLLRPLVDATAQQTGGGAYPVVIGGRTLQVIETTHSKLAKDDHHHPHHAVARQLAVKAVQDFWREMAKLWCGPAQPPDPHAVPARYRRWLDRYMNHPQAAGDWWQPILRAGRAAARAPRSVGAPNRLSIQRPLGQRKLSAQKRR